MYLKKKRSKKFVIAGGVASNTLIRRTLIDLCKENNFETFFPDFQYCCDNAAMIAMVGLEKFKLGKFDNSDFKANPRWALDDKAKFLKGAGVKY